VKVKLVIAVFAVCLLTATGAQAFTWHLSFYKVKAATKGNERRACNRDESCIAYGAKCERVSESRIDCVGATFHELEYGEAECWAVYHWGVNRFGRSKVRIGKTHCRYVE